MDIALLRSYSTISLRNSNTCIKLDFPEALEPIKTLRLLRSNSNSLKLLKFFNLIFVILIALISFTKYLLLFYSYYINFKNPSFFKNYFKMYLCLDYFYFTLIIYHPDMFP